jgi:hypothetical protein
VSFAHSWNTGRAREVSQVLPMKMMQALTLQVQRSALLDDGRRRK